MDQKEIDLIKTKSTSSVLFLSIRNFGIQGISTLGFFILTVLLGAAEVGLFAIVAESIGILGYFSDLGLAAALIQQKEKISKIDLRTTFTIQQILVFSCLIVVALVFPQLAQAKGYGPKETWILVSLCFAFVAASFKTIPSVLLERDLNFKLLSTIDIIENTIFYVVAVIFAFLKFGAYSYAIATFARSLAGLVIIYSVSPWSVGYSISPKAAKKLFKFGIPFQFNTFIAVAKDRLSNLVVAGIIGREAFGILSWAQKATRVPLSFMDAIMKVSFPAFSRLQLETEYLKKSISKSIYFISLVVFPALAGIVAVAPDLINLIPKYGKWLPAVLPLYFYAASAAIAAVTTPITNAFNAVGKITTTTKLMIMWTVLTWIFYPALSIKYGYIGTAIAALIVGISSFYVWHLANQMFKVNIISIIKIPLLTSIFMLITILGINYLALPTLTSFILKITVGLIAYLSLNYILSRQQISWFVDQLKCLLVKKSV